MIADAYFQCKPENFKEYNMVLMPDSDILPLCSIMHSKSIYSDTDKVICHCRLDCPLIQEMAYQTDLFDPLCLEAVELLGITWSYLGRTKDGVYERYPELNALKEDGSPILMEHIWA